MPAPRVSSSSPSQPPCPSAALPSLLVLLSAPLGPPDSGSDPVLSLTTPPPAPPLPVPQLHHHHQGVSLPPLQPAPLGALRPALGEPPHLPPAHVSAHPAPHTLILSSGRLGRQRHSRRGLGRLAWGAPRGRRVGWGAWGERSFCAPPAQSGERCPCLPRATWWAGAGRGGGQPAAAGGLRAARGLLGLSTGRCTARW